MDNYSRPNAGQCRRRLGQIVSDPVPGTRIIGVGVVDPEHDVHKTHRVFGVQPV
jgi:hypothetical protein